MSERMKQPFGTCVDNPFGTVERLDKVVANAKEIKAKEFIEICDVGEPLANDIKAYPNDYRFFRNEDIYFFEWSAIEHFYM